MLVMNGNFSHALIKFIQKNVIYIYIVTQDSYLFMIHISLYRILK